MLRRCDGFTLVELVIIIVTLGILAAVAVPRFVDLSENSKVTATKDEMARIKRAIVSNAAVVVGGEYVDRGFEGDVGFVPGSLADLAYRPDSIAVYDPLSRLGWNGPYLDSTGTEYLTDAWGNGYTYDRVNRRIVSVGAGGPGDSIIVRF